MITRLRNTNRDRLFQQAFAAQDPAPLLLFILEKHSTYSAIRDLIFSYFDTLHNNPYRAQTLTSALVKVICSSDAPFFDHYPLSALLSRALADTHFKSFVPDTLYGPKNIHLIDSLISGFSFKYNLCHSPDMLGSINIGLDAPRGSEESEMWVVGACIQLLLHGSGIGEEPLEVAKKLKAQKRMKTVKDPHALEVLELTIQHAETGFLLENDRNDVWSLLFPL